MRNVTWSLLAFSSLGMLTALAVPACTASGLDPLTAEEAEEAGSVPGFGAGYTGQDPALTDASWEATPGNGNRPNTAVADASTNNGSRSDAAIADASLTDASVVLDGSATDANVPPTPTPTPPVSGMPCMNLGAEYTKKCGACGTSAAVCEVDGKVGEYGYCFGQVPDGCIPGTTRNMPCGKCGTKLEVCKSSCEWTSSGVCSGEPLNACTVGDVRYTTAACTEPNTFRKQECGASCKYDPPAPLPCMPKETALVISNTVGETSKLLSELGPLSMQLRRPNSGLCPAKLSFVSTTYVYVEVKNTDVVPHKVEVWFDAPAGGADLDTVVAAYAGTTIPPVNRLTCATAVNDVCNTPPCTGSWSGLVGVDGPTIAAGDSIVIYHGGFVEDVTGKFEMFVKTVD